MYSMQKRRRRRKRGSRTKRLCRTCLTFMFSHVGLAAISVAYMVAGAVVFKYIEAPHESQNRWEMEVARRRAKHDLWITIRDNHTALDRHLLADLLHRRSSGHKMLTIAHIKRGYDGRPQLDNIQWSFPGAFFYSMTTISTVGYGNIACRTTLGRAVTIGYAIFGIPLMLLFLAIMGDTFSITCKFIYRLYLRQRIRFLKWRFKKLEKFRVSSALHRMLRTQLYHTVSRYGIAPPKPPIDEKLLAAGRRDVKSVSVPIFVLTTLMVAYLVAGATLFCLWEDWTFEEGFYFCFISLALIGFGDLFPGGSVIESWEARTRIIICALYLLFGMALIAMCFNLAQDTAIRKFRKWAKRWGLSGHKQDRRGSKPLDPRDVIVEGGPIGCPDEIPPLTKGDLQGPLLGQSTLVIPAYYGATGKTLRRHMPSGDAEKAKILVPNGTLTLLANNNSNRFGKGGRRLGFDANSAQTFIAVTKGAYILESRKSL